jgi:hypothetical protein
VSFLPAKTFDLGDSHPFDPELGQRFFHLFELERLNDGFQLFHVELPQRRAALYNSTLTAARALIAMARRECNHEFFRERCVIFDQSHADRKIPWN